MPRPTLGTPIQFIWSTDLASSFLDKIVPAMYSNFENHWAKERGRSDSHLSLPSKGLFQALGSVFSKKDELGKRLLSTEESLFIRKEV